MSPTCWMCCDDMPEVVIISVGGDNRFGHPHEPTLGKLGATQTYRTHQHGNIDLVKMARHTGFGSRVEPTKGRSPRHSAP